MDPSKPIPGLVNRLVAGIKEKTVKLAESKLQVSVEEVSEESILGFIGSAVRLGAQRLEVRVQGNDLILTHDGKKLTESEVAQLHRGVPSLPELSTGFRLHLGKDEGQIELHYLTDSSMSCAKFQGFNTPIVGAADLNDLNLANMTTRIILKGSGNYRRVNQAMGNELPEIALIRKRCFLAPLDLVIAGRSLDRYGQLPSSLITATQFETEHHLSLSTLASTPDQGIPVSFSHLVGQLNCIEAGICGIAGSAVDSGWYQIKNGVARPLSTVAWLSRTWGFLSLSENSPKLELEADIDLLSKELTARLFLEIQEKVSDRAEESLSFLEQNRAILHDVGHSQVEQDRVFLRLREQLSPSSDPRVLNSRLELASSLEASGDAEESEKLYAEVLPIWESEALNHFDKYRYEEGAALWQRALSLREKLGTDLNDLADKYLHLAQIGRDQRLGLAEAAFRRCLQIVRNCGVENKEREYKVLLGLAEVLKKNRVLTESLTLAEEAQKVMTELHEGKETKDLVPVLRLQAEIFDLMNDYARSTELEQKAMLLKFKR